jgi:LPXTG-motif cell wall-anchored protein
MLAALLRYAIGAALLTGVACMHAEPAAELKVLATDPAPDALLARQQPFYVRFAVTGAAPAAVTVSAWFQGNMIIDDGGTGAPALVPAGGTGVVSLFYWSERPTRIDELRLHVTDARSGAKINDYALPVALTWLADDPPPREPAAWVVEWQQARGAPPSTGIAAISAAVWGGLAVAVLLLAVALLWCRRRRAAPDDANARE